MAATSPTRKDSTTIRIPVSVRDELQAIATAEDQRVGDVIQALLKARRKQKFWEEMRIAVERTKADPVAWADYLLEARLWDTTSGDGLPADEDWGIPWDEEA